MTLLNVKILNTYMVFTTYIPHIKIKVEKPYRHRLIARVRTDNTSVIFYSILVYPIPISHLHNLNRAENNPFLC